MFAGFLVSTTFSAPPQIWLHRQFSSAQFRNEEMTGVMVSFGATFRCRFVLNSKRLVEHILKISRASAEASVHFFHGAPPDAEVRRIVCVEN